MIARKKKVAIVGYTTTRELAPYDDPEFEIWGINDIYRHIPRFDRFFQLHKPEQLDKEHKAHPERDNAEINRASIMNMQCPVYLQEADPEIPHTIKFPLQELIDTFSPYFVEPEHTKYFTNTIAYLLAFAIYEGFEEIHVYGVDMAMSSEFSQQRPSCEFWLGVAVGRGSKIHVPNQADLLKARFLYAYEDDKKDAWLKKIDQVRRDLNNKRQHAEEQEKYWREMKMQYIGADGGMKEMIASWE
jgi:hypothetical protein